MKGHAGVVAYGAHRWHPLIFTALRGSCSSPTRTTMRPLPTMGRTSLRLPGARSRRCGGLRRSTSRRVAASAAAACRRRHPRPASSNSSSTSNSRSCSNHTSSRCRSRRSSRQRSNSITKTSTLRSPLPVNLPCRYSLDTVGSVFNSNPAGGHQLSNVQCAISYRQASRSSPTPGGCFLILDVCFDQVEAAPASAPAYSQTPSMSTQLSNGSFVDMMEEQGTQSRATAAMCRPLWPTRQATSHTS